MNKQIKKDMELLNSIPRMIEEITEIAGLSDINGFSLFNRIQDYLKAQARITAYETERRVREEMKIKIGAMCGIPDAGDACRAILEYLSNPKTND